MSDRSILRNTILEAIKRAMLRPRYRGTEELADQLTAMVREAQHDAWTRGYAAAQLDAYDGKYGRSLDRRSPYAGGRHAGTTKPRTGGVTYNDAYTWAFNGSCATTNYPQTNPYPEGK